MQLPTWLAGSPPTRASETQLSRMRAPSSASEEPRRCHRGRRSIVDEASLLCLQSGCQAAGAENALTRDVEVRVVAKLPALASMAPQLAELQAQVFALTQRLESADPPLRGGAQPQQA